MPKEELPDAASFSHRYTVTEEDLDALGHANNISYVRWVQDVAVAHSNAMGLALADYQSLGAVFVIRRHTIDYLRPAMRGEELEVRTWIASASAASCERATEIHRVADGQLLATALTLWAFIDTTTGRPKRISDEVRARFGYGPRVAP